MRQSVLVSFTNPQRVAHQNLPIWIAAVKRGPWGWVVGALGEHRVVLRVKYFDPNFFQIVYNSHPNRIRIQDPNTLGFGSKDPPEPTYAVAELAERWILTYEILGSIRCWGRVKTLFFSGGVAIFLPPGATH